VREDISFPDSNRILSGFFSRNLGASPAVLLSRSFINHGSFFQGVTSFRLPSPPSHASKFFSPRFPATLVDSFPRPTFFLQKCRRLVAYTPQFLLSFSPFFGQAFFRNNANHFFCSLVWAGIVGSCLFLPFLYRPACRGGLFPELPLLPAATGPCKVGIFLKLIPPIEGFVT